MCILFLKFLKSSLPGEFKVILASNRDEFFKRPGKPAHFWEEDMNILGGRDMTENKKGGTWLAMTKTGKLGVLLNVSKEETNPGKMGRGFLVVDYLKSSLSGKEYIENVRKNATQYNNFHLVTAAFGSNPNVLHYSNEFDSSGINEINSSVFAVGNHSLSTPLQKVVKGKEKFEKICSKYKNVERKDELLKELLAFLKWDKKHYPDEMLDSLSHLPEKVKTKISSVFVRIPELGYGTRAHTIILIDGNGKVDFYEWSLTDKINEGHEEWAETHEEFYLTEDTTTSTKTELKH